MTQNIFEPPVVVKIYKTYLSFAPLLYSFPKIHRYSLGQTIERCLHALLELIFETNAMPRPLREAPLIKAQAKTELLKLLIRLIFELKLIDNTQYFQLIANLREVSKMIGGWISYVRQGPNEKL